MLKRSIFSRFFEILARPGLHRGPPGPGSDTRLRRAGRVKIRSAIHCSSWLRSLETVSTRRTCVVTLSMSENPYTLCLNATGGRKSRDVVSVTEINGRSVGWSVGRTHILKVQIYLCAPFGRNNSQPRPPFRFPDSLTQRCHEVMQS